MDEVIAYIREKAAVSRRHAKRGDPADRPTHEHTARVLDILADEIAGGIHARDDR